MFSTLSYLSPIITLIVNHAMLPNAKFVGEDEYNRSSE